MWYSRLVRTMSSFMEGLSCIRSCWSSSETSPVAMWGYFQWEWKSLSRAPMFSDAHCSILLARVVVPTYSQPTRMSRICASVASWVSR